MRLLDKHSRNLFITNLLILLLGGCLFYGLFSYVLDQNIRDTLQDRRNLVRKNLALSDSIYIYQQFSGHIFSITRLPAAHPVPEYISDTIIYDLLEGDQTLFKQLTFGETIRGQPYLITVRRPLIDKFEILRGMLVLLLLLTVLLVVILNFANRQISRHLWQPFYATLARLRHYHIDANTSVQLPHSDVTEFEELNQVLKGLINRVQEDYYAMKEYSENTAHEIQTPLAVIQGKLELLQEQNLTLPQLQLVHAANQAVNRLSRLKEALLLLARINNRQYTKIEPIHLAPLIHNRLQFFEELLLMEELQIESQLDDTVTVELNPMLAEVLIDNLISNAVKHNQPGGVLTAELTPHQLVVRNTGKPPQVPPATFFERFAKSDPQSKSLGLGLAIVKAICDTNGFRVDYQYTEGLHQITVLFTTSDSLQIQSVSAKQRTDSPYPLVAIPRVGR